jgi:mannose-6-phosphate isomerase-like protein (cupin superfamily)
MMFKVILSLSLAALPGVAATPSDFVVWPKGVVPAGSAPKIQLGNHGWSIVHREKSGAVESHETRAIVMIVQSGEATLVVGTDVVDAKNVAPGEIHGTSIRNGVETKLSAGDIINMPIGLPHQFVLLPGQQITYIDVVINTP